MQNAIGMMAKLNGGTRLRSRLVALWMALMAAACAPMPLTPITPAPTGRHQPGQVVWHDLLTDDVAAAKRFYGPLFGWTFQTLGRYTLVLNNGSPIAGMVEDATIANGAQGAWWVLYLSVDAVDETARWVEKAGGSLIRGPAEMANRGRYAMIGDPQGAALVLLRSDGGDPHPTPPPVGGWLWSELWTSDTAAALTFYQSLGDYAAMPTTADDDDAYWVLLGEADRWQAGITTVPFEAVPPQWVPVVRVDDPAALAARVPALGGKVLVNPDHPLGSGYLALIKDPSGAILMVESWQPSPPRGKASPS
jgi:predicted enzyme related to lactoylglutathione lyase